MIGPARSAELFGHPRGLLTMFAGNFLGGFWSDQSGAGFFALIAGAAVAAGAMIELARRFRSDLIPD